MKNIDVNNSKNVIITKEQNINTETNANNDTTVEVKPKKSKAKVTKAKEPKTKVTKVKKSNAKESKTKEPKVKKSKTKEPKVKKSKANNEIKANNETNVETNVHNEIKAKEEENVKKVNKKVVEDMYKKMNNKNNMKTNYKRNSKNDIIIRPFNKELLPYFVSNKKNSETNDNNIQKYQNSFDDIINFSKSITLIEKKSINCIIFHVENSDGMMSAYIVIKFLLENKTADDILFIPARPSSGAGYMDRFKEHEKDIKGRNVIIIDLQYNKENLEYINRFAKNVIIIDDHPVGHKEGDKHFIGNNHSSVAYTKPDIQFLGFVAIS